MTSLIAKAEENACIGAFVHKKYAWNIPAILGLVLWTDAMFVTLTKDQIWPIRIAVTEKNAFGLPGVEHGM